MTIPKSRAQLILLLVLVTIASAEKAKRTYVVHMEKSAMPESFADHQMWYDSSLKAAADSAEILYTYSSVFHGFSTRLSDEEAESLSSQIGVLSVLPELRYELHTTRSPEFLGLERNDVRLTDSEASFSDVIVGVLDTGVWPESRSFDDTGMESVPRRWKGECVVGSNFSSSNCNNKLIGARFFYSGYEAMFGPIDESVETKSARDDDGHGTHTATTAAGSAVAGASLLGYAAGTARGMATKARVAAYKICWLGGCFGSDILAAMDKAIEDGVDILSLSIGGSSSDYFRDSVAVGAYTAMTKGILVSCSAGNGGPGAGTLSNVAPWITTVGAGTIDRDFPAYVSLGNGRNFSGVSLYSGKPLPIGKVSVVYAANASNTTSGSLCISDSLIPSKVAGKIVVCDRGQSSRVQKGLVVKEAGGVGMILANTESFGEELVADAHLIPASAVGFKASEAIKAYVASGANPTATIAFAGTQLNVQPSPVVAAFSSRGPNPVTPEILKPDLIAPGVNILASWTGRVGPTGLDEDKRRVSFNIISGTSMSCPHVSGLAALIKGSHPDWSPAAIKSALMTTAYSSYKNGETIEDVATGSASTPFDFGAGHVDPVSGLNPGLVYDLTSDDYLEFLCALNYSSDIIKRVSTNSTFTCSSTKLYSVRNFNYPSFAVPLQTALGSGESSAPVTLKYTRTLTNVGTAGTYKVSVSSQTRGVKIAVEPAELSFSAVKEKKSYTVTFTANSMPSGTVSFDYLIWSDGKHTVSSPIAFSWT